MYDIYTANKKTEKRLLEYFSLRLDIKEKLERLKAEPRKANGAHPLHGRLAGKFSCWLGSNIRMIYSINDRKKQIIIEAVGSHKIY
ncbi:MAG: hypothetical protein QXD13_00055 [Candidatus Pacearchaeota archaeon]